RLDGIAELLARLTEASRVIGLAVEPRCAKHGRAIGLDLSGERQRRRLVFRAVLSDKPPPFHRGVIGPLEAARAVRCGLALLGDAPGAVEGRGLRQCRGDRRYSEKR